MENNVSLSSNVENRGTVRTKRLHLKRRPALGNESVTLVVPRPADSCRPSSTSCRGRGRTCRARFHW